MALTHLVDTSVLTRLRRGEVDEVVEPLTSAGRLGRATISDLEIGYSARNASEWDGLMNALEAFDAVEINADRFNAPVRSNAPSPTRACTVARSRTC